MNTKLNPCIFYHSDAYSMSGKKLMGRNAAGASFLKGFLQHGRKVNNLSFYLSHTDSMDEVRRHVESAERTEYADFINRSGINKLKQTSSFYYPGPDISKLAQHRRLYGNDQWSICGITHTTSSMSAMDAIVDWIIEPVQPWDAVICTSSAVKKNVEVVLQARVNELQERLGITKVALPHLPVIPLGIQTSDFIYSRRQRSEARSRICASDGALVVLYVGRLSFHAKAHPLAMYQAIEAAAQATGKEIILVECGWHGNDYIEKAFAEGAALASPSVRVVNLDGRKSEDRETAWASADVFCSLSDNIQETFGIVPIEAMAAGLPVVVSDWDGYRDTVRDGVDGFRIPTIAPCPGMAGDLANRHALEIDTYDMYCGYSSSLVAIHLQKLIQAFIELFKSPELRQKMGSAGRKRAVEEYDWRDIIPRYENLWDELTKIRLTAIKTRRDNDRATQKSRKPDYWAARLDPTIGFANYPTQHLSMDTHLTLSDISAKIALSRLAQYKKLDMVSYASYVFPKDDEIKVILKAAELSLPNSAPASALLEDISERRKPYVLRSLSWLCKLGILKFK